MTFKIPYTFIPGTKAKANEVNANFTRVSDYLKDLKADISAVETNFTAIGDTLDEGIDFIRANKSGYCVAYSNGALLSHSDITIYFSDCFGIIDQNGTSAEITNFSPITCNGYSNGKYNIFVGLDESKDIYNNTIYRQSKEPSNPQETDVWVNTQVKPLVVSIYSGGNWVEYNKVPLGCLVISNSVITEIESFPYNQNGYDINVNTNLSSDEVNNIMPSGMDYVVDYYPKTTDDMTKYQGTWWRKYRSGLIEQGGLASGGGSSSGTNVTMPKAFSNTLYTLIASPNYTYTGAAVILNVKKVSTTQFNFLNRRGDGTDYYSTAICWFARGF